VQASCRPAPTPRWARTPPASAGSTSTRWSTAAAARPGELRALQDWFLRYELKSLPGVAEVATIGGMVRQYQVVLDPDRLRAYGLTLSRGARGHRARQPGRRRAARDGRSRIHGARQRLPASLEDFRAVPLRRGAGHAGAAGRRGAVRHGPEMRRGIAELNGEGEVVGGIVVMRSGENAREVIAASRTGSTRCRPACRRRGDRHHLRPLRLIDRAVANLTPKLVEEFIVVGAGVRGVPVAPALVAGGHRLAAAGRAGRLHRDARAGDQRQHHVAGRHRHRHRRDGRCRGGDDRERAQARGWSTRNPARARRALAVVTEAASEVGPALFFSLLIITLSFMPVFTLEAQEGPLFAPLAYTKTYAMAAAAACR
jgi:copper/silver efflux system protein